MPSQNTFFSSVPVGRWFAIAAGAVCIVILIGALFLYSHTHTDKYDVELSNQTAVPTFRSVPINFTHFYAKDISLPLAPSALIDINNDAVDEVFFGGGLDQQDALFSYQNDAFTDIIRSTGIPRKKNFTTLGVGSADFDNNGFTDLIVSREDGLTIYYNQNGRFTTIEIGTPIDDQLTPTGITLGDVNKDGHVDIFLTSCQRKDLQKAIGGSEKNYISTSALLINKGNNTFINRTVEAGLAFKENAYSAMIVDIDNNSWLDLVVAYENSEIRIYENKENLNFVLKDNPLTGKIASLTGIASGDYNNDGFIDFFFSNSGSTLPAVVAKAKAENSRNVYQQWILLENNKDFTFTNVADRVKLSDYEWSKGAVMADMNNDGLQDLIVAENDVDFAPAEFFKLPGRFLLQQPDTTFIPVEKQAKVVSREYSISPLVSDFNLDGYLDLIWTNINAPVKAYISNGGDNNYIQVKIASDAISLGAKVNVLTPTKNLLEHFVVGEGLCSDQTSLVHFGLGKDTRVYQIMIYYTDSRKDVVKNPKINTVVDVKQRHLRK